MKGLRWFRLVTKSLRDDLKVKRAFVGACVDVSETAWRGTQMFQMFGICGRAKSKRARESSAHMLGTPDGYRVR